MASGLSGNPYIELKMRELIYIMRQDYSEKELVGFVKYIKVRDLTFSDSVYRAYSKVNSVKELARLSYYSLSGFKKHFEKVFGVSASKWIKEKRTTEIYREIMKGEKTFKEISLDFDFSSPAHFNDFCKQQLGNTPGKLRKTHIPL
jgi:AraC-like DNA-binding protein